MECNGVHDFGAHTRTCSLATTDLYPNSQTLNKQKESKFILKMFVSY